MRAIVGVALLAAGLGACGRERPVAERSARPGEVTTAWGYDRGLEPADIERGRHDAGWREVVDFELSPDTARDAHGEVWDSIDAGTIHHVPMQLPLRGDVAGPSVLRAQILLDRALFSPGQIDGRWGKNTEKAVYWFQRREGLRATGEVDRATFERLVEVAGAPDQLVVAHVLTEDDVAGPFVTIPSDIYAHAELECSCYESLTEKLGERFHADPALLARLNPDVDLDALRAGDRIHAPRVRDANAAINVRIARLVISDRGHYVHALGDDGRLLLHFPSTLGSTYDPSPAGAFEVRSITEDPWWHYQPAILAHVDDAEPDARIPPGPNSAVGLVWMALSEPHYGIHGTNRPETIGYATSAGCVRLTNWDALFLGRRIEPGLPVEFRDRG